MKKIINVISLNRSFFIGYLLFLVASIIFLALHSKIDGFILLNSYHSQPLDLFFMIYTNIGDGLYSIGLFLLLLWFRKPLPGWEIVFTFLLAGLMVQVLKYIFPMPRPQTLLGNTSYPYFIHGLTHVGNASFPSGHTATAFGTVTILYLLAAILVGYSRIYLGQHFLMDVLAGALIGVPVALIVYFVIDSRPSWIEKLEMRKMDMD